MTAIILDGRALARELREELSSAAQAIRERHNMVPRLAVLQVQGDPASERYAASLGRLCERVGIGFKLAPLPADASQAQLEQAVRTLSDDPEVHGILVEMPLPPHFSVQQMVQHLDYRKDVDGIHPLNVGLLAQGHRAWVPNTPAGGMELLRRYQIDIKGKRAAVVGYSDVVGRPMAEMLISEYATVTICHEHTTDLRGVLRECDLVIVAVGKAGLISGEMLRPGAVVVDFGINVQPDGSVVGDVVFEEAVQVASAITPVPGGTGPVTNIMLLRNVLFATRAQLGIAMEHPG
jgi:methylenetetrahydrofolate dehydrogenase (NADP+)/methenyltetrahydrofolate cyclohydrolase